MIFRAVAELVLDWQNLPFSLPNLDKAKDSLLGVRTTIIEQTIVKTGTVPDVFRQTITIPLVREGKMLVSEILPKLVVKANTAVITIPNDEAGSQIPLVNKQVVQLAQHKRLTSKETRAYIEEQRLRVINGLFDYVELNGVFQNPLQVMEFQGLDPDTWDIEESLFGQFKSFFTPNVRNNDGGEIRITEGNVQNHV